MTESLKLSGRSAPRDRAKMERDGSEEPTQVIVVGEEQALAQALEDAGYEVQRVTSAGEAEDILASRHVDTLIVDYDLFDMRGDLFHAVASAQRPHLGSRTLLIAGPDRDRVKLARESTKCPVLARPLDLAKAVKAVEKLI